MSMQMNKVQKKVMRKSGDVQYISDRAIAVLNEYSAMEEKMKVLKDKVDMIKASLYNSMEDNDVKSFETDDYKFTLIEPSDYMGLNTEQLKKEGLYEFYKTKPIHKDGYVKYTRKRA